MVVPTIVLSELQSLYEKKMPHIPMERILRRFTELSTVVIAPFDMEVFREFRTLPSHIEMHDRMIAATAKLFGAGLISRDRVIAGYMEAIW